MDADAIVVAICIVCGILYSIVLIYVVSILYMWIRRRSAVAQPVDYAAYIVIDPPSARGISTTVRRTSQPC